MMIHLWPTYVFGRIISARTHWAGHTAQLGAILGAVESGFVNFGLLLRDFLTSKIIEATEAKIWAKEAKMKKLR